MVMTPLGLPPATPSPSKSRLASELSPPSSSITGPHERKRQKSVAEAEEPEQEPGQIALRPKTPDLPTPVHSEPASLSTIQDAEPRPMSSQEAMLHPHSPPYEDLLQTLMRHLELSRTIRSQSHPHSRYQSPYSEQFPPSEQPTITTSTIFASLRRELQDALSELNYDTVCHVCTPGAYSFYGQARAMEAHLAGDGRRVRARVEKDVGRLTEENWMEERRLRAIAIDVRDLRREWKRKAHLKGCAGCFPKIPRLRRDSEGTMVGCGVHSR